MLPLLMHPQESRKMHPARKRLAAAFQIIYDHVMSW